MHNVYRPARNPLVDCMVRRRRVAIGQVMIERKGAVPTLLRVLRRKGYIGLLIDQHAKRDGVWVPFFGRPASTTPAPALLALRTGAPILTVYSRRLPGTYQFHAPALGGSYTVRYRVQDDEGTLSGIDTANLTAANMTRAVLEGMVRELADLGRLCGLQHISHIVAGGNAVRKNPLVIEIIEKAFGLPCRVGRASEEAALGAAFCTAVRLGLLTPEAVDRAASA